MVGSLGTHPSLAWSDWWDYMLRVPDEEPLGRDVASLQGELGRIPAQSAVNNMRAVRVY